MYTLDCTNCPKSPPNDSSMLILIAETFTNHCTNQFETCFIDASANDQTSSWWMFYKEEIKQLTSHVYILKKYCQIKRAGNLVWFKWEKKIFVKKGYGKKIGFWIRIVLSEIEGRREISGNGFCVCSLFLLNPTLPFHLPGKSLKSQAIFCSPCTTAGKTRVFEANNTFWLVFKSHYLITPWKDNWSSDKLILLLHRQRY